MELGFIFCPMDGQYILYTAYFSVHHLNLTLTLTLTLILTITLARRRKIALGFSALHIHTASQAL